VRLDHGQELVRDSQLRCQICGPRQGIQASMERVLEHSRLAGVCCERQ
jgi:hypothetical protein